MSGRRSFKHVSAGQVRVYLVQAEAAALRRVTQDVQRPYAVVLGGAKVADKLLVVSSLLGIADQILVGAMAVTFLAAQGHPVGLSLLEGDLDAARLLTEAWQHRGPLLWRDADDSKQFREGHLHWRWSLDR